MTEVTIERLGMHGDGIAAGPVYVQRVLPGEVVAGDLAGDRLDNARIVTPSPDRVAPPCRHYKGCGGCSLQHARDGFVEAWKREVVMRALAAQGIEAEIAATHTSPANARRRAKLSGRRTKGGALVGFHGKGSDTLVAVPDCKILRPEILVQMPMLEALTIKAASRKSEIGLLVTVTQSGLDVVVETERELTNELRVDLAEFAQNNRLARLTWGDEPIGTLLPPTQRFGAADVAPPPGAFLQATAEGQAALTAAVLRGTAGAARIVDLFAGAGTFSLPMAKGAEVHAVEGEAGMLAALDKGWRVAQGLKRITTEPRDLFRRPLLPDELARFDAAVIDPPRAGAEAQMAEIAASTLKRMVMVSCNPVTFARDARTLVSAGFRMGAIEVVDQFRWSPHIELVAAFAR